jgi:hypothetical protein
MRRAARETAVSRYDTRNVGLPAWMRLIDEIIAAPKGR